jgi:hypothetical protein
MADVEIFKCPSKTIMYVLTLDESILILMEGRDNHLLESIGHDLSNEF